MSYEPDFTALDQFSNLQINETKSAPLWVEKYKPTHPAQIVGNQDNVYRLSQFLLTWESTFLHGSGGPKRAMLISGPPGVGKSSAVGAVARSLGYDVVEFNASDLRNQASLELHITDLVSNRAVTEFFPAEEGKQSTKTCLVMDEVDGMSSGADRGGILQLVKTIKRAQLPIVCICNDIQQMKLSSLKFCCQMIHWRSPFPQEIVPRLIEILALENISKLVNVSSMEKMCEMTRGDMRQIMHLLQFWSATGAELSSSDAESRLRNGVKDFDSLGPFETCKRFFRLPGETKSEQSSWVNDRLNDFFEDMDLMGLMVQQNYLNAWPDQMRYGERKAGLESGMPPPPEIESFHSAADYISWGDLANTHLHSTNDWELSPFVGVLSAVAPGACVASDMPGMSFMFPAWLGKTASANKNLRLLRELHAILSIDCKCPVRDMGMFTLPLLREKLLHPLIAKETDGFAEVFAEMDYYGLTRNDWSDIVGFGEALSELNQSHINLGVKAAFARKCNLEHVKSKVERPSTNSFLTTSVPVVVADEETIPEPQDQTNDTDDDVANETKTPQPLVHFGKSKVSKPAATRKSIREKTKTIRDYFS